MQAVEMVQQLNTELEKLAPKIRASQFQRAHFERIREDLLVKIRGIEQELNDYQSQFNELAERVAELELKIRKTK